jgi:hypothetical protein
MKLYGTHIEELIQDAEAVLAATVFNGLKIGDKIRMTDQCRSYRSWSLNPDIGRVTYLFWLDGEPVIEASFRSVYREDNWTGSLRFHPSEVEGFPAPPNDLYYSPYHYHSSSDYSI